jgi:hypothetical protein
MEDLEEQFGPLPASLVDRIAHIENYDSLRTLRRQRKNCKSSADFEQLLAAALN